MAISRQFPVHRLRRARGRAWAASAGRGTLPCAARRLFATGANSNRRKVSLITDCMDGVAHLASVIAAHLREWDPSPPFVELVFGTRDANAIALMIDTFCGHVLGAPVAHGLFHQSSIGSVTGVALDDGRRVVIKAHQRQRSRELLVDLARIQNHLSERGLFVPKVIAGPLALGHGHAMVEPFIDVGATANARRPEVCRALAHSLRRIITACETLVASTSLGPGLLSARGHRCGRHRTASYSTSPRLHLVLSGSTQSLCALAERCDPPVCMSLGTMIGVSSMRVSWEVTQFGHLIGSAFVAIWNPR